MSNKLRPSQYADQKGTIAETHVANVVALAEGTSVPADGTAGYSAGSLFLLRGGTVGAQLYINQGSVTSSAFKAFQDQTIVVATTPVNGVAAGYRLARGQQTTVTAADTVVTGLTTVLSVVATLESAPTDTCDIASAQVGNQSGAPAAGSIVINTWKVTTGGAAGNPTLVAATAFSKLVNWIAVGT